MTFCCREKCLSFVETLFDVNKEKYLCRITVNPHDDIFSLCTHAFNIKNSYSTCESRGNFDSSSLLKFDKEILNIGCPGSRSSLTQNFLLWRFFVENGKVMFCFGHAPVAVVVVCLNPGRLCTLCSLKCSDNACYTIFLN